MSRPGPLPLVLGVAVLIAGGGCDSKTPVTPSPPVTTPLSIVCPAPLIVATPSLPVDVTYPAPTTAGGTAPIQVSCTIPSGSPFPFGQSDVVCTARDARQLGAQCTFAVQVSLTRQLQGTSFLAFGDSITAGEVAQPVVSLHVLDPTRSYPTVLQALLRDQYVPQAADITVVNRGKPGEGVVAGEDRLADAIDALHPNVLLLIEGANDANGDAPVSDIVDGLVRDIRRAFERGVTAVYISTLLPEVPGRPRAYDPERIVAINDELVPAVGGTGAVLIDGYAAFAPQKELLIGDDGLHPTAEGYEFLAGLFFDAIRETFEEDVPPAGPGAPTPIY